jgi:hypothetical protein
MRITSTGNVGIGTNNPTSILQVGGGGKLRIGSGDTDYTMIGTSDVGGTDNVYNTRILLSGNNRPPNYGRIEYQATTGDHIFYTTYNTTERMRITSGGNVGIGTNNPTSILQVGAGIGNGIRLRISNGASDYTVIGTSDTDSASTNTRIAIWGNTQSDFQGHIHYVTTSTGSHRFYNGIDERMRITSTGNVGIGTNNPTSILQVGSSGSRVSISNDATGITTIGTSEIADTNTRIGLFGHSHGGAPGQISYVSMAATGRHVFFTTTAYSERMIINANGNVVIGGNLNVGSLTNPSDSRIKKDIEDINDATALNKLLLIQPTTYNYIDVERNKGFGKVYGFIAQQIREVIPEAVTIVDNIIPNIYKNCICEDNKRIYIVLPQEVLGVHIKLSDYGKYTITKIESDYIEVEKHIESKDIPDGEQFVFGYSVDDFHTLNKEYIFTLNVCATQELHRRIEAQSVLLKLQDDRIKDLETKVAMLMSSM